jgi:multiple sugar transport system permease protein
MLIGSLKPNFALFAIPPNLNPLKIILANYKYVFTSLDIARWYGNSIFISAMISLITVTVAATAGYAFAKHNFWGKGFWFAVLMATMMLPRQILMVPNFMVAKNFGLIDRLMGVVLTSIPASFGVFMCKQFMSTLPNEMIEAAKIDGCSEIRTFMEIILPLSGPVLGALAIFSFVGGWNDFVWQNIILTTKDNRTMPLAIAFLSQEKISYVGYQMAGATLSAIPMIAIFIKFQKYFIRGLTVGSVKG